MSLFVVVIDVVVLTVLIAAIGYASAAMANTFSNKLQTYLIAVLTLAVAAWILLLLTAVFESRLPQWTVYVRMIAWIFLITASIVGMMGLFYAISQTTGFISQAPVQLSLACAVVFLFVSAFLELVSLIYRMPGKFSLK